MAVSAAEWRNPDIGIVRLEITFTVEGNDKAPTGFNVEVWRKKQEKASRTAASIYQDLCNTWGRWDSQQLQQKDTIEQMCGHLKRLRDLLEAHPRLEDGAWYCVLVVFCLAAEFHFAVIRLWPATASLSGRTMNVRITK